MLPYGVGARTEKGEFYSIFRFPLDKGDFICYNTDRIL